MSALERRLDSVIYRMGSAPAALRRGQIVRHGHIDVNGRSAISPSAQVKSGRCGRRTRNQQEQSGHPGRARCHGSCAGAELDRCGSGKFEGSHSELAQARDLVQIQLNEQLIVEFVLEVAETGAVAGPGKEEHLSLPPAPWSPKKGDLVQGFQKPQTNWRQYREPYGPVVACLRRSLSSVGSGTHHSATACAACC